MISRTTDTCCEEASVARTAADTALMALVQGGGIFFVHKPAAAVEGTTKSRRATSWPTFSLNSVVTLASAAPMLNAPRLSVHEGQGPRGTTLRHRELGEFQIQSDKPLPVPSHGARTKPLF
ncbi:MAG: hypothetical protein IPN23_11215 [Elusimicrobia bacterium]|nr:hypothetical protein [Elusimicrobiota bacterium]